MVSTCVCGAKSIVHTHKNGLVKNFPSLLFRCRAAAKHCHKSIPTLSKCRYTVRKIGLKPQNSVTEDKTWIF